jgi:hypothetical protein
MTFDEWWAQYECDAYVGYKDLAEDAWKASKLASDGLDVPVPCKHCRFPIENARYAYRHVATRSEVCPGGNTYAAP